MNLDQLRSVQSKERQTDSLQHLRESFYSDASEYISELEAERDQRASEVEDPFADSDIRRLTDEVETAREVVEAIYDRRLGKLVKRASLAAAAHPADEDGLTAEEQELYDDLVGLIEANKTQVLDVLDTDPERDDVAAEEAVAVTAPDEAAAPDEATAPDEDAATVTAPDENADEAATQEADRNEPANRSETAAGSTPDSGTDTASDSPTDGQKSESHGTVRSDELQSDGDGPEAPVPTGLDGRTTVRITGDVGEFFGVDQREYDLEPETVVALPAENAEPLLESGDAERVE